MMKRSKIYSKIAGIALATLAMAGCSDTWNDHYDAPLSGNAIDATLWEVISNNEQLSNFAKVVAATGYDKSLASTQVFTVFAPTNDALSEEEADAIIALYQQEKRNKIKDRDNKAIKQFVQNHIALYNHSVAKSGADSVVMMNGKYQVLTPEKLSNSNLLTTNQLTRNGLLFTLSKQVDYQGNVLETLQSHEGLDSIGNFISSFNEYEFLPSASVAGGIEDGKTWYLDSVSVLTNDMFDYTDYINSEDSVFWMVAPTNEVWNQLIAEYEPYFNYDNDVQKRDSLAWVKPRLAIISGTVFSQTRNARLKGEEFVWNTDSAMSVNAVNYNMRRYVWGRNDMKYYQYDQPFGENGVYKGTEEIDCSNGKVIVADKWNIDKKQTFLREVLVEAENRTNLDKVVEVSTRDPYSMSLETWSPFYNQVSNNGYMLVQPRTDNSEIRFKLPNLLSNVGYDIYVVFVPAAAVDSMATNIKSVKFQASISYHNEDGTQSPFYYLPDNNDKLTMAKIHNYITDANAVDTVKLTEEPYVFPTCSWGLRDSQVFLNLKTFVLPLASDRAKYTGVMRIDCIIIKPHEEESEGEE